MAQPDFFTNTSPVRVYGVDEKSSAHFIATVAKNAKAPIVLIAPDQQTMAQLANEVEFYLTNKPVYIFAPWDVQPYDRIAPDRVIQAQRMQTLAALKSDDVCVIVTTPNALYTRIPPVEMMPQLPALHVDDEKPRDDVIELLVKAGYSRVGTVMEPGEYAVRGSILDIYCATASDPVRLDYFDDEIESIKIFDPSSQRTTEDIKSVQLAPASELVIDEKKLETFRQRYRMMFAGGHKDPVYERLSACQPEGMAAHYLPLFFEKDLPSFFDVLPKEARMFAMPGVPAAIEAQEKAIEASHKERKQMEGEEDDIYRPLAIPHLYLGNTEWVLQTTSNKWVAIEPFEDDEVTVLPYEPLVFDDPAVPAKLKQAVALAEKKVKEGVKVVLSALSAAALTRMERLFVELGYEHVQVVKNWREALKQEGVVALESPIEWGFEQVNEKLLVITEQDLFGAKQVRRVKRKRRKGEEVLSHYSELSLDDLVVHMDHGIGQFSGLQTLDANGEKQDFITLVYHGGDKLFVPVVGLDAVSRYGGDPDVVKLDKLGGAAWQARKAKVKKNLLEMADGLIEIAAKRKLMKGFKYPRPDGLYDAFCGSFAHNPTEEQQRTFEDVESDMFTDKAMDRLVVGDVGFGKTEVAMRAAFIAAAGGKQVAVVVPTTLLAQQHYDEFKKRFTPFALNVKMLCRLVTGKEAKETQSGLEAGRVDIVIGTHALLSEKVKFKDLGLMIVDEEQRFGVAHKEKLKAMRENVDVLTLTATPIPRTMQMSMSGMRDLSMITTPPVDRQAIRTYVMKYDGKVVREAILREIYRGGQVYIVTPRVSDIEDLLDRMANLVPEAKVRAAHGQMPKDVLERVMHDFYDKQFNVLIATTIIESGLDVPSANTLIVNKADRFGLSQLYQIRGRVGRSRVQAYAYMMLPQAHLTVQAEKRLRILQRLNGLGAGFTLASYDLDLRGAGNILGKEQSGQIKEVGFELYNQMLGEAVAERKNDGVDEAISSDFTPNLKLGVSFMLPEDYVPDLNTRMVLYRRVSHLQEMEEVDDFADELMDRFGPLPDEVVNLLDVVRIRNRCKALNISEIEAGAKGAVISFYEQQFGKPQQLMVWIMDNKGVISVRPDQSIVVHRNWPDGQMRLDGVRSVLGILEKL